MFEDPPILIERRGSIEVISGCMFSGKTEELLRRVKRAIIARQRVGIFKPGMDTRFDEKSIVSHDDKRLPSTTVEVSNDILFLAKGLEVIAIDEAQFFDENLPQVCNKLASTGIRVVVAGLDMDFRGNPFGPVPELMAIAEIITKLHAVCVKCGNMASYSFRKTPESSRVLLGEKDHYEPRCRVCFVQG